MNFFGHSVVAGWIRRDPHFALGAMLPDFAAMCGSKVTSVTSEAIEQGIEHHHDADAIFHQLSWFTLRNRRLSHQLRVAGLRRGPALGASHVGIEIALDSVLAESGHDDGLFAEALSAADPGLICWRDDDAGPRFATMLDRIAGGNATVGADVIAERVRSTLRRRPRLALEDSEMGPLGEAMHDLMTELRGSASELLAAMRVRVQA